MLTLIGSKRSRTFRVLWMLEELGLDYTHHPESPRSDEVRRLNPSGKIPVLIDGETVLTDSSAILMHLADREGRFTHAPGSVERARQDAFLFRILDELEGPLWMRSKQFYVWPEERRMPQIEPALLWEFETALARIAKAMTGPYLTGGEMTVPDIVLAHCLRWAKGSKWPVEPPEMVAFLDRMQGRDAFGKVVD